MKNLIKYTSFLLVLLICACETTELDLLDNPNAPAPEDATVPELFNNIQLDFLDLFFTAEDHPGQMARMYTNQASFNYAGVVTPVSINGIWFSAYSEMFPDIDLLLELAPESNAVIESGAVKILKAYALITLVDLFVDVPFSQAGLGVENLGPVADPGDQVYDAALALLDEAIVQLTGTDAPSPSNDLFFGGNAGSWITLANTLKLRAAVTTRRVNGDATSTINSLIAGDIIDDESEDFAFQFGNQRTNPNSRHPFYNLHYEIGDGPYLSNYYMFLLRADKEDADGNPLVDPRIRYYFYRKVDNSLTQDQTVYSCHLSIFPDQSFLPDHISAIDPDLPYCVAFEDGYYGRDHLNGQGIPPDGPVRTSYGLYPAGGQFDDDTFQDTRQQGSTGGQGQGIAPILLSSFVDFMRAEAALTLGTNDDPRVLLESGIRTSIAKVQSFADLVPNTINRQVEVRGGGTAPVSEVFVPSAEDVDAYVEFVLAEFDAADNDGKLNVIIREYYIAAWGNGLEAYNMWRRTGKPNNMIPTIEPEGGDFPRSYLYPDVYVNRNANATQKTLTDRTFWDDGTVVLY